jgi:hypothetical protein
MRDVLFMLGVLVIWFGLSRWVLPWFGIPTCMSGGCRTTCSTSWDDDTSCSCKAAPRQSDAQPEPTTGQK